MSSRSTLLAFFRERLAGTPTRAQVEAFEADLARSSHELMHAALLEMRASGFQDPIRGNFRGRALAVYERKLAEQARLFPIFFILETAYRAFVAARLEAVYGTDNWWVPVRDGIAAGLDVRFLTAINGRSMSKSTIRTIEHLMRKAGSVECGTFRTGYDVVAAGSMAHVGQLLGQHWSAMLGPMNPGHRARHHGRLTSGEFTQLFDKVRNARNTIYHHRSLSGQARVVEIAEELLELLDIDLGSAFERIDAARLGLRPLAFRTPRDPSHD